MALKILQLISILLSALVAGMFFGPWLALTRSIKTFGPEFFLAVVNRLNHNMAAVMTRLMPITLLSMIPVLILSFKQQPLTFYFTLIALALFIVALMVTMLIEVPIVKQIITWQASNLPDNWQHLRDRWGTFHMVRIVASLVGFILLVIGAMG